VSQVNREERAEALETQIASAIGELEAQLQQGHSEEFLAALAWWGQFRDYSFNNSLLIAMQRPNATQVAGFRAWEKLGFHVRRGERAIFVRGPIFKKLPDPETGELVQILVGYIPVCVFDISQCAEYPAKQLPEPLKPATGAEWEYLYDCWRRTLLTTQDIPVTEMALGNVYGLASKRTIRINAKLSVAHKATVLLHELSHIVAGHTQPKDDAPTWTRQDRELQVEAASYVLCRMLGAEHPSSRDYLLNHRVQPGQLSAHLEVIGSIVRQVRTILNFKELVLEDRSIAPEVAA
jgi:hypothetical protein